jgi:hypothetical protein
MREERLYGNELKAVWVLENTRKEEAFSMNGVELLYLEASVTQWKKMKKTSANKPCYLITTEDVREYLETQGLLSLWDGWDTEILSTQDSVSRQPFWASSKIKAMKEISAPFVMMDNDFYFETPLSFRESGVDVFDGRYPLVVSHTEDGGNYVTSRNPIFAQAGIEDLYFNGNPRAFNVSFLYIRDEAFRIAYSTKAWNWLEKLSSILISQGIDKSQPRWRIIPSNLHGGHMTFCEQKLLYDMADDELMTTKCLIPEIFDCEADEFPVSSLQQQSIQHLGRKKLLLTNPGDYAIYEEIALKMLGRTKV